MNKELINKRLLILFVLILSSFTGFSIEIDDKSGEFLPDNVVLINEKGALVQLDSLINKPTLINFVYFNCKHNCQLLLDELKSIAQNKDIAIGKDYQIVTISFDHSEKHGLARKIKQQKIDSLSNIRELEDSWHFLTGDSSNIALLTKGIGFNFEPLGKEFIHKISSIIVNGKGKIIRYNLGVKLLPLELKLSFIEGEKGNILPRIYKKDEYCYPEVAPAYKRLNSITRQIGFVFIVLAVGLFAILIFKPRKRIEKQ